MKSLRTQLFDRKRESEEHDHRRLVDDRFMMAITLDRNHLAANE